MEIIINKMLKFAFYSGSIMITTHYEGKKRFLTRLKIWGDHHRPCRGKYQRGICIMSVGELQTLNNDPHLFVNKFERNYHPLAYDCMEQRIFRKVLNETKGPTPFNDSFYKEMDFVKNHI